MYRKMGQLMMVGALLLGLFDRLTSRISDYLGRRYCAAEYLQPVDGVVGEASCGFDADMYLMVILVALFLLGLRLQRGDD